MERSSGVKRFKRGSPEDLRQVTIACDMHRDGYNLQAIAARLGITKSAASRLVKRGAK